MPSVVVDVLKIEQNIGSAREMIVEAREEGTEFIIPYIQAWLDSLIAIKEYEESVGANMRHTEEVVANQVRLLEDSVKAAGNLSAMYGVVRKLIEAEMESRGESMSME